MQTFQTSTELLQYIQSHDTVRYRASLHVAPTLVRIMSYTVWPCEPARNKARLQAVSSPYLAFTANLADHDRFCRP
jgi:hypothetical protein